MSSGPVEPSGTAWVARAAAALDANFGELLAWYGSFDRGEIRREPDLLLTWSGVPFRAINAAALADLEPTVAHARIDDAVAWLSERTDRWRWLVGPSSRPAGLEELLVSAGLGLVSDTAGMALDLHDWTASAVQRTLPAGVSIEPVVDEAGLERWRIVQQRGLGLDDDATEAWWIAHRRAGFEPGQPLTNWIATLDGRPVSAAALFTGANVAGIYNVCTVPEARGHGIGAAVTVAAIDEGVAQGLELAILGASEMGYSVYRRLGFQDVSRLRSYAVRA